MIIRCLAVLAVSLLTTFSAFAEEGDLTPEQTRGTVSASDRLQVNYKSSCDGKRVTSVTVRTLEFIPAGIADDKDMGGFHINRVMLNPFDFSVDARTGELRTGEVVVGKLNSLECTKSGEFNWSKTATVTLAPTVKSPADIVYAR